LKRPAARGILQPVTTRIVVIFLAAANLLAALAWYGWPADAPSVSEAAAPAQGIPYQNGGDPFAPEAARKRGRSYLSEAVPGRHEDSICYIRINGKHHEEISSILWSRLGVPRAVNILSGRAPVKRRRRMDAARCEITQA